MTMASTRPFPTAHAARHFVLHATSGLGVPLEGARHLLAELHRRLGSPVIDAALVPQRALLALVLAGLGPSLSPAERAVGHRASAGFLGFLPNTGVSARPMLLAWADLLATLVPPNAVLVVPDALGLDPGTLVLLRLLLARRPADRIAVRLTVAPRAPADAVAAHLVRMNHDELELLRVLPGVDIETAERRWPVPLSGWHPLDTRREADVFASLRADTPGARDAALATARASFAAYGFALAHRLGEALLARDPEDPAAAELHTVVAVAAVHLAPPRATDDPLLAGVDAHLAAALATERHPRRRLHLLFRACIRGGRAPDGPAPGGIAGDVAVAEADAAALPGPWRAYLAGWCRNARAYALFRSGRGAEAAADCRRALAGLDGVDGEGTDDDGPPAVELGILRFHLANNLCRLAWEAGEVAAARAWQAQAHAFEAPIPFARRTLYRWADPALDLEALELVGERLHADRRDAEACGELARLGGIHHELGLLAYRRGDAVEASQHHARANALCVRTDADPGDRLTTALNAAVSAWRAGDPDAADDGFVDVCATAGLPAELLPELFAARGLVAADRGDRGVAEAFVEAATTALDPADDPRAAARVMRTFGEIALRLGDPDGARTAFEAALAVPDAPPEDRFGALLGRVEAGEAPAALLDEALALAPAALADPNAWWELPRLLRALVARGEPPRRDADAADPLARTLALAAQRTDCRALVARLRGRG
jgi:tetratricopeptide (TPR) repeat protein